MLNLLHICLTLLSADKTALSSHGVMLVDCYCMLSKTNSSRYFSLFIRVIKRTTKVLLPATATDGAFQESCLLEEKAQPVVVCV